MKDDDFNDLVKSIKEAGDTRAGKRRATRRTIFETRTDGQSREENSDAQEENQSPE